MHASAAYLLLDVFTDAPFAGNQLAVFPDARALDAGTMQRIARELNLAESVFLTPTGDDARPAVARIFTPLREVPFAGHPTVGAAVAVAGVLGWTARDRFVLAENVGDVPIRLERTSPLTAWLTTPPVTVGAQVPAADAARVLGLAAGAVRADVPPAIVSAGSPFLVVTLTDEAAVDAARLDGAALAAVLDDPAAIVGVFLCSVRAGGTYARMFAPMSGIPEDPATGSATGPLYAHLLRHGAVRAAGETRFVSEQGAAMGRRSLLHVRVVPAGDAPLIEVGGNAVVVGEGRLQIEQGLSN